MQKQNASTGREQIMQKQNASTGREQTAQNYEPPKVEQPAQHQKFTQRFEKPHEQLANALKKREWFVKKQEPATPKEATPNDVYRLEQIAYNKHEKILIAAENAQNAVLPEAKKEEITDLAIKADDIYEKKGDETKKAQTNLQKLDVLHGLAAELQKIEYQMKARWPDAKFA